MAAALRGVAKKNEALSTDLERTETQLKMYVSEATARLNDGIQFEQHKNKLIEVGSPWCVVL